MTARGTKSVILENCQRRGRKSFAYSPRTFSSSLQFFAKVSARDSSGINTATRLCWSSRALIKGMTHRGVNQLTATDGVASLYFRPIASPCVLCVVLIDLVKCLRCRHVAEISIKQPLVYLSEGYTRVSLISLRIPWGNARMILPAFSSLYSGADFIN